MRIKTATQLAHAVLGQHIGIRSAEFKHYLQRIKDMCQKAGGRSYIDQEQLLSVCLDEWHKMDLRARETLGAMFTAGDVNCDGIMSLDEFAAIVKYVEPELSDRVIIAMFREAHKDGQGRMTKKSFVATALKNGLLTYRSQNNRIVPAAVRAVHVACWHQECCGGARFPHHSRAAAIPRPCLQGAPGAAETDSMNKDNTFVLLAGAWAEAKVEIADVFKDTCPKREFFQERADLLQRLIDSKLDADAAWLCFRILLREHELFVTGKTPKELASKEQLTARRLMTKKVSVRSPARGERALSHEPPLRSTVDIPHVV